MRTITPRTLKTLQVLPQRSVHAHFTFRFENNPGNQNVFCFPRPKYTWNESTTSSADGRLTHHEKGVSARPQAALKKFDSARLSRKKKKKQANFVNRRKLLLKGYNFKESNTTDLERDLQRTWLRRSTNDRRRRTWAPSAVRSGCLFLFFLRSYENFRFAFLALNVSSQCFTWKISICSAKSNHVLCCSLSGELAMGRARLRTGDKVAASQLQLT